MNGPKVLLISAPLAQSGTLPLIWLLIKGTSRRNTRIAGSIVCGVSRTCCNTLFNCCNSAAGKLITCSNWNEAEAGSTGSLMIAAATVCWSWISALGSVLLFTVMSPHNLASNASKEFSFIEKIETVNNCLLEKGGWGDLTTDVEYYY